jgi:predicted nuclease of predicted toxin-antitoxin system
MKINEIKFLANVNVEKPIVDFLTKKGFDIKWITNIDKRISDVQVCEIANNEKRIVVTNDKDFGEIAFFQRKISFGVILLRIKGQDPSEKIALLSKLLDKYHEKIPNHFVVVTREKFRFIPLEVIKQNE